MYFICSLFISDYFLQIVSGLSHTSDQKINKLSTPLKFDNPH